MSYDFLMIFQRGPLAVAAIATGAAATRVHGSFGQPQHLSRGAAFVEGASASLHPQTNVLYRGSIAEKFSDFGDCFCLFMILGFVLWLLIIPKLLIKASGWLALFVVDFWSFQLFTKLGPFHPSFITKTR